MSDSGDKSTSSKRRAGDKAAKKSAPAAKKTPAAKSGKATRSSGSKRGKAPKPRPSRVTTAAASSAEPEQEMGAHGLESAEEEEFDSSAWADDLGDEDLVEDPEFTANDDPLAGFFVGDDEIHAMRAVGLGVSARDREEREAEGSSLDDDYLSFILDNEEYAVPITALKEIVRPIPITTVPRTPSYVLGVITLRGTVLPVLDLRVRLGLGVCEPGRSARILVVETNDGSAGIWADRVSEVVRIGNEPLEPPPGALGGGGDYLQGIIRRDGRMLIVLNLTTSLRVELAGPGKHERKSAS